MELAKCVVRLNGDIGFEVAKTSIPFAEVRMLQEIHGADSVVRIERCKADKRQPKDVSAALRATYGEDKFRAVFPGANPNMSLKFADLVPDAEDIPDDLDEAATPLIDPTE